MFYLYYSEHFTVYVFILMSVNTNRMCYFKVSYNYLCHQIIHASLRTCMWTLCLIT